MELTGSQIAAGIGGIVGALGMYVISPLIGMADKSRRDAAAQFMAQIESNKDEIESLKADNRKLHERMGEEAAERRHMGEMLSALKTEIQYVKSANAQLLTDNAKLEAENVSLKMEQARKDAEHAAAVRIFESTIAHLEDEVDEQLIFQDKPPKYDRPQEKPLPVTIG